MTDRSKFEQMLEHLVNEDTDKAKELFHQLVVEKSREIYENILADDFTTEGDGATDPEEGVSLDPQTRQAPAQQH
jgi:two-component SAPR family response regulator